MTTQPTATTRPEHPVFSGALSSPAPAPVDWGAVREFTSFAERAFDDDGALSDHGSCQMQADEILEGLHGLDAKDLERARVTTAGASERRVSLRVAWIILVAAVAGFMCGQILAPVYSAVIR